jgi:hypothetical protein
VADIPLSFRLRWTFTSRQDLVRVCSVRVCPQNRDTYVYLNSDKIFVMKLITNNKPVKEHVVRVWSGFIWLIIGTGGGLL